MIMCDQSYELSKKVKSASKFLHCQLSKNILTASSAEG